METILISGIGGPTPRSIAKIVRLKHPEIKIIGIDANPKAVGFFMSGLLDEHYTCPKVSDPMYWNFIENLITDHDIDFAIIQPEKEIIAWGDYHLKNGKYPCPTFLPPKELALTLMDKSLMADILDGTDYIPKTIKVTQEFPMYEEVEKKIGFPCWIRATQGSGGLGSLKIQDISSYKSWLFIHSDIKEFTVSEFLPGRHLANQMLYKDGFLVKTASLECVEYVMASVAPSKVTGNTSFGRLLYDESIDKFCNECIQYVANKLGVKAEGVLSFDLKEDKDCNLKVTEVNIRHMAYTGILALVGFDLITDTIEILRGKTVNQLSNGFNYEKPYVFLRDVDIEPILLESEDIFQKI